MALKLKTQDAIYRPTNLSDFISQIRRYKQGSIITSSGFLCWEAFRNKKFAKEHSDKLHLVNAYAPRIAMLALATGNNHRNLEANNDELYNLCSSYLGLPSSISDRPFMDEEAKKIADELENRSNEKDNIQKEDIFVEKIRETCSVMFLSRGVCTQHRGFLTNIEELYRDYRIIQLIDKQTSGAASQILEKVFGMSVVRIIRSAWCLFALGCEAHRNGIIDLDAVTCDEDLTKRLEVDLDTCKQVAHIVSYKASRLRSDWLENQVLVEDDLYQQYVTDPSFLYPLIHQDNSSKENQFVILSPDLFIRAFRQSIFSILYQNAPKTSGIGEKIGVAMEKHIQEALERIFQPENVTRLEGNGKHADFLVSLDKINIVIEVKLRIGSMSDMSIMKPDQQAKIWNLFYGACQQCASSVKETRENDKKTVSIVIVADHITSEYLPFYHYATRSGILNKLGTREIECISWNALEKRLSQTSIKEFENALIEKWRDPDAMKVENLMGLEMNRAEPAHSYEYLAEMEQEIFNKMDDLR